MRDFRVDILESQGIDIDIVDGEAAYVEYDTRTADQRAALAVYAVRGTVPGMPDYGVSWSDQYTNQNTVAQLNNEIQQQVQEQAGFTEGAPNTATQYNAMLLVHEGEVGVIISR